MLRRGAGGGRIGKNLSFLRGEVNQSLSLGLLMVGLHGRRYYHCHHDLDVQPANVSGKTKKYANNVVPVSSGDFVTSTNSQAIDSVLHRDLVL